MVAEGPAEAGLHAIRPLRVQSIDMCPACHPCPVVCEQAGIMFQDVTTIMLDPVAFKHSVDLLVERYREQQVDVIAGACRVLAIWSDSF